MRDGICHARREYVVGGVVAGRLALSICSTRKRMGVDDPLYQDRVDELYPKKGGKADCRSKCGNPSKQVPRGIVKAGRLGLFSLAEPDHPAREHTSGYA